MKQTVGLVAVSCLVVLLFVVVSTRAEKNRWLNTSGELTPYPNETLAFVTPAGWPEPVYDFSANPLTTNGIELGRALFYDPILSADSTTSQLCFGTG